MVHGTDQVAATARDDFWQSITVDVRDRRIHEELEVLNDLGKIGEIFTGSGFPGRKVVLIRNLETGNRDRQPVSGSCGACGILQLAVAIEVTEGTTGHREDGWAIFCLALRPEIRSPAFQAGKKTPIGLEQETCSSNRGDPNLWGPIAIHVSQGRRRRNTLSNQGKRFGPSRNE